MNLVLSPPVNFFSLTIPRQCFFCGPFGVMGQVWYLIILTPDLYLLPCFRYKSDSKFYRIALTILL